MHLKKLDRDAPILNFSADKIGDNSEEYLPIPTLRV